VEINSYIAQAVRTAKPLPTLEDNREHAVLGMITEMGEIATSVKRAVIYSKGFTPEIVENIGEEVSDFLWYVALAAHVMSIRFETIWEHASMAGRPFVFSSMYLSLSEEDRNLPVTDVLKALLRVVSQFEGRDDDDLVLLAAMIVALTAIAMHVGLDIDQLAAQNLAKLRERFPLAYSDEAAEARADKGGLDVKHS
jgi:hypothetical protein